MLDEKHLISGIKKTIENAKALLDDAAFLFKNGRYARAYALFQLSIEEAGKCLILYNSILRFFQGELIDKKKLEKYGYLDHKSKTKDSLKLELTALLMFKDSGNDISNLLVNLAKEEKIIAKRNDKKNESLYVSLNDKEFLSPKELITKTEVQEMAQTALIRVKVAETYLAEALKDMDKIKFLAKEILRIENDPNLEAEFREKLSEWINE